MTRTLNRGMSCDSCTHIQAFYLRCLSKEIIYHSKILGTLFYLFFNIFRALSRAIQYKMCSFAFILCRQGCCFKRFFWSIISLNLIGIPAFCNRIKCPKNSTRTKKWLSWAKYSLKIIFIQNLCHLNVSSSLRFFYKWITKLRVKQI